MFKFCYYRRTVCYTFPFQRTLNNNMNVYVVINVTQLCLDVLGYVPLPS